MSTSNKTLGIKIPLSEVAKHNTKDNCWMIINGNVYDVTSYIDQHPGEDEIIKGCGIDATILYGTRNGIGHSPDADKILQKYYIADLKEE